MPPPRPATTSDSGDLLRIDGAEGEGGGQILRTSLTCSLLTGRPFELHDIRANRDKPGLRAQHLECVLAAAAISGAKVEGAALHSQYLRFTPGPLRGGDHEFRIQTAGSTSLLLQTVLLPLAFSGEQSSVRLGGGTHQKMAPSFHFLERGFLPGCRRLGVHARASLQRPGYFPRGGGRVLLEVEPLTAKGPLRPLQMLERGDLVECRVITCFSNLPEHVTERATKAAVSAIESLGRKRVGKVATESFDGEPAMDPGGAVLAVARWEHGYAAFESLAARGVPAEDIGRAAGVALVEMVNAGDRTARPTIDEHLADQLLLPCALATGQSEFRAQKVSQHLLTNADVLRRFLPSCRVQVDGELNARNVRVAIDGVGMLRPAG